MATSSKKAKIDCLHQRGEYTDESYWDRLPIELQEKILMMAARDVHRQQWQKHEFLKHVCLVLDLDGYRVQSWFIVREMGWCTRDGDARSLHFKAPYRYGQLSAQDKRTVKHVYQHVHALPFNAQPEELAVSGRIIPQVVRCLYLNSRTLDRPFVAYKDGHLEKNLLNKLNIPAINLEWFGCPRADQLGECELNCGFHHRNIGHCPQGETYLFQAWISQQLAM